MINLGDHSFIERVSIQRSFNADPASDEVLEVEGWKEALYDPMRDTMVDFVSASVAHGVNSVVLLVGLSEYSGINTDMVH